METLELKSTIIKIKNFLEGLNRFELAEEIVNLKVEVLFRSKGIIKTSPDTQKGREFVASRCTVQEILKEVLQAESKRPPMVIRIHTKITSKGNYVIM